MGSAQVTSAKSNSPTTFTVRCSSSSSLLMPHANIFSGNRFKLRLDGKENSMSTGPFIFHGGEFHMMRVNSMDSKRKRNKLSLNSVLTASSLRAYNVRRQTA